MGEISESFEYGLNAAATEYDGKHKYIRITDIDDSTHLFLQDDLTSPDIDFSTADDYLLQEGDVLFARTGASVGKTYIYRRSDGDLYFAGFLIRAKIKSDYDADFVFQNTLTDSYDSYIRITSQRSGQPGVNAQEYANFALSVPSLAEQKKIGAYFSHLDSLITLHQREYFSFGFGSRSAKITQNTLSWEQRKLSDLFEERNEQAPMDEEYPLMAFIANIGVAPKGDRYDRSALVHDEKGKKYKRTEKGDFIYSSNNLETGSIGLNNYGNACISPVYSIFKSKHTVDPEFMGRILLRKEFINQMVSFRQGVVYGQWKIHEDDFLNLDILVPQTTEQQKIGGFFSELDKIITLHQHKPNKKGHDVLTVMPFKGNQRKPHYLCT